MVECSHHDGGVVKPDRSSFKDAAGNAGAPQGRERGLEAPVRLVHPVAGFRSSRDEKDDVAAEIDLPSDIGGFETESSADEDVCAAQYPRKFHADFATRFHPLRFQNDGQLAVLVYTASSSTVACDAGVYRNDGFRNDLHQTALARFDGDTRYACHVILSFPPAS